MDNLNLSYPKDMDGNYVIKNVVNDNNWTGEMISTSGEYSETLIISNNFFEKKLRHKVEDIVKFIEENTILRHRVKYEDIISEKFVFDIKDEQEFNPLFQRMNPEEIEDYTRDSKKVRVHIVFEIYIKQQKHLWLKSHLNFFKKKLK